VKKLFGWKKNIDRWFWSKFASFLASCKIIKGHMHLPSLYNSLRAHYKTVRQSHATNLKENAPHQIDMIDYSLPGRRFKVY
jgi:hypothetical protein